MYEGVICVSNNIKGWSYIGAMILYIVEIKFVLTQNILLQINMLIVIQEQPLRK